jgi:hypothetical protein
LNSARPSRHDHRRLGLSQALGGDEAGTPRQEAAVARRGPAMDPGGHQGQGTAAAPRRNRGEHLVCEGPSGTSRGAFGGRNTLHHNSNRGPNPARIPQSTSATRGRPAEERVDDLLRELPVHRPPSCRPRRCGPARTTGGFRRRDPVESGPGLLPVRVRTLQAQAGPRAVNGGGRATLGGVLLGAVRHAQGPRLGRAGRNGRWPELPGLAGVRLRLLGDGLAGRAGRAGSLLVTFTTSAKGRGTGLEMSRAGRDGGGPQ